MKNIINHLYSLMNNFVKKYILFILYFVLLSCSSNRIITREKKDLSGIWQFATDSADAGVKQRWYLTNRKETVNLPGTTDLNKKGILNTDSSKMHLSRVYKYEGVAWYCRKVTIPESYRGKHIELVLERTKLTEVWIDSVRVGGMKLLQSPHRFDVSRYLTPGEHSITIRVDNTLKYTPYGNVHIYSDDTQTNWNGIIGELLLEVSPTSYIGDLQVKPDVDNKKIAINLSVENSGSIPHGEIEFYLTKMENGKSRKVKTVKQTCQIKQNMTFELNLGKDCSLWDEYKQPLYTLTVVVSANGQKDAKSVVFGMRKFSVTGTQFAVNGRTVFLRGKHDAAVFPLTGHTPMHVEEWERVFRVAKSYGINHYRFHSYCPPDAAFTAADRTGIYIQAELPFWGGLDADSTATMLLNEGIAMIKAYGNHPSFVMFSPGNEIWSGHDRVEKNILAFKNFNNRLLYTMGSNNNIGYAAPRDCSDYFIGARTPYNGDTTLTHTRLTHAFADTREGGILNTQTPSTLTSYSYSVSHLKIPLISHEIGQYQIYPDYNEINKYTGVLRARNLEIFRNRLIKSGMMTQNKDFQKASGAWAARCYNAEMETAIRTRGMGGFQLLDLQDFPGQGTALVGILDAFMDSKNVISAEEWRQSCNDVVLLAELKKYCWTNREKFTANISVANYSPITIKNTLQWELTDQNGVIIKKGILNSLKPATGDVTTTGSIEVDLSPIRNAKRLNLHLSLKGNKNYSNSYPIWVYETPDKITVPENIVVADKLNVDIIRQLENGANVLLFPATDYVLHNSLPGLFPPDFWNYGMFKSISESNGKPLSPGTLGILTDPKHPVFHSFPTDYHTNWQWFSIIKASRPMILDQLAKDYKPIVQVIDNLERNHKLGLIFEFKSGKGKLLVCMSQLNKIADKPEAAQLYRSIISYMNSTSFQPVYNISGSELYDLFK